MNLRLIKNNQHTTISGSSLEDLNYQKDILELENSELFDVCCFSNDDTPLPTTYFKMAPKTIRVFNVKTIKIRNDFEQWCDVQGIEQTKGSDNELSTIVSHYNIQRNDDIVKDYFTFQPMTIFTTDYWYSNSIEFNAIAQYYKGNHDTFAKEHWDSWYGKQGKDLITQEERKYLPFVNYIKRLGYNYE